MLWKAIGLAALFAVSTAPADAAPVRGAGIQVDVLDLSGGAIHISGKRLKGSKVKYVIVDGLSGSHGIRDDGTFDFRIKRRPDNCRLSLVTSDGSLENLPVSNCGPRGPIGRIGASGYLEKRFVDVAVAPSGANTFKTGTTFASLSFEAPLTGIAVLEGRGSCRMANTGPTNEVLVGAFTAADSSFDAAQLGVFDSRADSTASFNSRRSIPVKAGQSYNFALRAFYQSGAIPDPTECSGTFSVTVHQAL